MHKTIHVELVGGESTSVLGVPGTVFVAGAAVLAAVLAAAVTIWKMRRDLAHDRQMRDRDDARNTLYSALDAIDDAKERILRLKEATQGVGRALKHKGDPAILGTARQNFDKAQDELSISLRRLNTLFFRTLVRFRNEKFGTTLQVLKIDVEEVQLVLGVGRERSLGKAQWIRAKTAEDRFATGVRVFSALCHEWFTEDDGLFDDDSEKVVEGYLARAVGEPGF